MPHSKRLPKEYIDKRLEKADTMTFFGIKVKDLTREELIAAYVEMAGTYYNALERHKKEKELMDDLNKAIEAARGTLY